MPHYRDRETGRFVSEETYTRSVSQGGERYDIELIEREKEERRQDRDDFPEADYGFDDYIYEGFEGEDADEY